MSFFFPLNYKDNKIIRKPRRIAANALCRLGNQMFIAAATRTFAALNGLEFYGLVKLDNESDYPEYQMRTIMRNVPFKSRKEVEEFKQVSIPETYLCDGFPNIPDDGDILFSSFFQDNRCIDKGIAYDLFKPYDSIIRNINDMYGDLSGVVCINVRRGDYLINGNQFMFNVLSKEQIDHIISSFFSKDRIMFVSDDIEWCKDNFRSEKYMFCDKPYVFKPEIDLYIQTQCKSNVISNSTFSWWGAYLNERVDKVIVPWPWFKDVNMNQMKTLCPENWIKINF